MTIKTLKDKLCDLNYMVSVENKKIIVLPTWYYRRKECMKDTKVILGKYTSNYQKLNGDINHNAMKLIMKFSRTPVKERHYEQDFGDMVTLNELHDIISHHYGNLKIEIKNNKIIIKTPPEQHDVVINAFKSTKSLKLNDLTSKNLKKLIKTFAQTPIIYRGYHQYKYDSAGRKYLSSVLNKHHQEEVNGRNQTMDDLRKHFNNKSNKNINNNNYVNNNEYVTEKHPVNIPKHYAKTEEMQWTETERNYFAWLRMKGDAEGNKIYGKTDADTAHTLIREVLKMDEDGNHIEF